MCGAGEPSPKASNNGTRRILPNTAADYRRGPSATQKHRKSAIASDPLVSVAVAGVIPGLQPLRL
eukprot:4826579-Alexandrium_andersonii.AAC.1